MAATVGYEDPNNLSHMSCRAVQKAVTRSGFGLYISRISKPALNTVEAACSTKIKTADITVYNMYVLTYTCSQKHNN